MFLDAVLKSKLVAAAEWLPIAGGRFEITEGVIVRARSVVVAAAVVTTGAAATTATAGAGGCVCGIVIVDTPSSDRLKN